jgi:hypothetical protein
MRTVRAKVLNKQDKAVRLLREGKSYDEIAKILGYANRGSAWRLVQNALRDTVTTDVEEHRAIELHRLDALQHAHWDQACDGDIGAAVVVLRVIEQRSRLLGLCEVGVGRKGGPTSIYQPGSCNQENNRAI